MIRFLIIFGLLFSGLAHAEAEKKVVCHVDEKDKNKNKYAKPLRFTTKQNK